MSDDTPVEPTDVPATGTNPSQVPVEPATETNDDPVDKPADEPTPPKEEAPKPDEPAEEPDPAAPKEEPEAAEAYQVFDDPSLNQITSLLNDAKLPVEDAKELFQEAMETGDLSKLDMEALEAKVGKDKAEVIRLLAENYTTKFQAKVKETLDVVHGITGGEDNLKSMQEWITAQEAADTTFAKDMVHFRQMLESDNPIATKSAVTELFSRFKSDPNTTISADVTEGDNGRSGATNAPLSRAGYTSLVEDAIREGTYNAVQPALQKRRAAGIKLGLKD